MDHIKAAFLAAFKGRTDVVPKLFHVKDDSGAVVRSGYAPICANFWTDSCPKRVGQKQACDKFDAKGMSRAITLQFSISRLPLRRATRKATGNLMGW